jgi:hypothetical protein
MKQQCNIAPISPRNCGKCGNTECDWHEQREQLSRMNRMVNREYVDHFSMRLATEMTGCRCFREVRE